MFWNSAVQTQKYGKYQDSNYITIKQQHRSMRWQVLNKILPLLPDFVFNC